MKLSIVAGATSQSCNLWIQDLSGNGLTGLVFNSSGLISYYSFTGANAASVQIVLATLATLGTAYSSGGFKEIDATNMPGWYRFDIPNAALATSKGRVVSIHFKGAANMADLPLEIELTGWDNQLVPGTAGGMLIAGSNAGTTTFNALTVTNALTVSGNWLVSGTTTHTGAVACNGGVTFTSSTGDGFVCSSTGGNGNGVNITGTGTGYGLKATSGASASAGIAALGAGTAHGFFAQSGNGATGDGIHATCNSTNGHGIGTTGAGTGDGISATGGTTGRGFHGIGGATSGAGARFEGTAGNSNGAEFVKQGSGQDLLASYVAANFGAASLNGKGDWLLASNYTTPPTAAAIATAHYQDLTSSSDFTTVGSIGKLLASMALDSTGAIKTQANAKKNQALAAFAFMMTDSTNHAPATGKTVTCTRLIDAGTFGAGTLANVTEATNGMYHVDFGAGDLNGNNITLRCTAIGCDDTFVTIITVP